MNDYQQSNSIMRVAVGVVAFSGMDTLRVCLDSLLRQDYDDSVYDAEFKVIINDKKKYDIPGLMESYPDVEFIVPPRNTGYAGAIYALWKDHSDECDIIAIANDDLTFRDGWFTETLKPFARPDVFAVTCSVINHDEEEEKLNGTLNPIGIRIPGIFEDRTKVLFPSGAAFAFRKDAQPPVDPKYFLYYEDVYLGLKARLRGFDVVMNPDAKVDHFHRRSTSIMPHSQLHYFQELNRLANIYLFFEGWTLIKLMPYFLADLLIRFLQMLSLNRRPDAVLRAWVYYLTHVGTTLFRRFEMGKQREVRDREILRYMSARLLPPTSLFKRTVNIFFLVYSKLVRLNFAEFDKDR